MTRHLQIYQVQFFACFLCTNHSLLLLFLNAKAQEHSERTIQAAAGRGESWGQESLTKSLFFKIEKKKLCDRLCKVRISHLSCSYVILHAASVLFQKNFCVTIHLNFCPLKLQHQASHIT